MRERTAMLSEPQTASVVDLVLGRIDEAEFVTAFGTDPRADAGYLPGLLVEAARRRDPDIVEAALTLMFYFDLLSDQYVRVLSDLLIVDWHQRHEDVARALQQLSDPIAVPALRQAAELDLPYFAYDEG